MRRAWPLVLVLLAMIAPAAARADWAPDSCDRPPRARAPYGAMLKARQWTAAADSSAAILARWSERSGVDSVTMACLLLDRVALGPFKPAEIAGLEPLLRRALAIASREPGRDSLFLLRARYTEADWTRTRNRSREADSLLHLALAMMERRLPVDHLDLAGVLMAIATVRQQAGRTSGLPYIERAIRIQELRSGPQDPATAFARYQLASQLLTNGDPARARVEGERAIAVIRRVLGEQHPDLPRYTRALGILAMNDGDYSGARRHLEETLALTLSHQPVDSMALARNLATLSELRNDVGDYEQALAASRESIRLQRGRIAFGTPQYAPPFVQAGRALAALGAVSEANACLDSAFASAAGDSTLTSYGVLARAYAVRASGDTAAALAWARRARELGRSSHEPLDAYQAEAARFHADCLVDAGRPEDVVREIGEAVAAAAARYGDTHPAVTRMREAEARALAAVRDPRAPEAALALARRRREDLIALASGFSEQEALFVARREGHGLDPLLAQAAAGRLDAAQRGEALGAVASARGLVLEVMVARVRESRLAATPESRAALDSLAMARAELARAMVRGASDAISPDSALRASRAAVQRRERQLADLTAGAAPVRALRAGDLQAALRPGEALVSFAVHRSLGAGEPESRRMLAFVTRPDRAVEVHALGDADALERQVLRWRDATGPGGTRRESRARGDSLRRAVWDPLTPLLAGASRVFTVADGPLQLVDLSVLPGSLGGWLVEEGPTLARLSSERDLLASAPAARGVPLVVGAPDFERSSGRELAAAAFRGPRSACARFAGIRFEPLPGALAEGEQVVARLTEHGASPRWLSGAQATETAFKREAEGASSLHVATHGFFLGEACGAGSGDRTRGVGRLVPAGKPGGGPVAALRADVYLPERAGVSREHPMRLAGLAFAGANHRSEAAADRDDGILTSEEIAALDLSGVAEVVLSACDTGAGDIAVGEGVFGLQRAFRLAGAGSMVMSLWPVRDEDARAWMDAYYRARGLDLAVADAVRAASRERLAALRARGADEHPSRWAGFFAVGR